MHKHMQETVTIRQRFHGPPGSGNGGYTCGKVAGYIDGPASVRLHIPPPLDVPMEICRDEDHVLLMHEGQRVATGRTARVSIDAPRPPDFKSAQAASRRYRGFTSHFYPGCFVCGPQREPGDGLRVFAGPLERVEGPEGLVAAAWVPEPSLADSFGMVLPEYLWAVLDCPGAYAFPEPLDKAILLGELAVTLRGPVKAGERLVLLGWEMRTSGRKHFTGTALYGETGDCLALGHATWLEVSLANG